MINKGDDTLPDPEDLSEVLLLVLRGGDDDGAVQQVQGDPVRAGVAGAPGGQHREEESEDCGCCLVLVPDLGDAPVGGHHHHGGEVILQRSVEEGEALHVQHVHLTKETIVKLVTYIPTNHGEDPTISQFAKVLCQL